MKRFILFLGGIVSMILAVLPSVSEAADRPHILWITSEDNGPHLGAYGDPYATTPNLDGLAARGMIYLNAWSTAPVCAPARTTIISGMYPTSTGSQHMRSMTRLPEGFRMYPQFLREAGYSCSNNSKEDYNLQKPGKVWDDSSNEGHWRNREPGQPFFAIFNFTTTHESQIRSRPHTKKHDPRKVSVPPYHPDTPETREDWAQYHDKMTEMDARAGELLKQLEEDGLAGDTIIFYYGDHGSGMPRSKRWLYNSGLRVPLIVYVPPKFAHLAPEGYVAGGSSRRLVGFIDLAPTVLSLVGIKPPDYHQGHAFMGPHATEAPEHLFGFRDRMDERYDLSRAVRDERYLFIRNYMPHRPQGQYLDYMFQTPTTRVWKEMYDAGKLEAPRTHFWEPKLVEELYDIENDPHQVHNLTGSPGHRPVLDRLRKAHRDHVLEVRDLGFLPESEIHTRAAEGTPYEYGQSRDYRLGRILDVAQVAASNDPGALGTLRRRLEDSDPAVRYWAVMGFLIRGEEAVGETRASLRLALEDDSPSVRVLAAEALGRHGNVVDLELSLKVLAAHADLRKDGLFVALLALNAIDGLGGKAAPIAGTIRELPTRDPVLDNRLSGYAQRLVEKILEDLAKLEAEKLEAEEN
jgi:uncharacterized sulfatase